MISPAAAREAIEPALAAGDDVLFLGISGGVSGTCWGVGLVAQELAAHGYKLFYYDNRSKGEVDYLIDDYDSLSAVPIEVKSGKDYTVHSALNTFVKNDDYHVKKAYVLSNAREITTNGKITYLPIYDVMFLENVPTQQEMN